MTSGLPTRTSSRLGQRLAAAGVLSVLLLSMGLASQADAKKPLPPPPTCAFSTSTGLTTCVTVSPEVVDHEETPTLPDAPCVDASGDPGTQTQSRRDVVYRTDTTTQKYTGRQTKPQNLLSTTTTSTYRTVTGTLVLGPCQDGTAPETSIITGPSGSTTMTAAAFSFVSDESGSTFSCSLDAAEFTGCTSPAGYSGLAVGGHTFRVRAADAAGNVDTSPAQRTWQVVAPTPAPVVTITDGPTGTTNSPHAVFSFSSTQPGSFRCQLDGAASTLCGSSYGAYNLSAGAHTFTVTVTNDNGTSTATRSWTIEANLPVCSADATSFSQLANGDFAVVGTGFGCLEGIMHTRVPVLQTCQGGGVGYSNPAKGTSGTSYIREWTDTRIVFDDDIAAGQWSICITLEGEFNGLEYIDARYYDYVDFMAGPDPFNVTAQGSSSDGLRFTGSLDATSDALPPPFVGATVTADFTHAPVTGTACVQAAGTWQYESENGTLLHLAPMTLYARYCPTSGGGEYRGLARVSETPGDLLFGFTQFLSYRFTYDSATGTFTSHVYGGLDYTVR